MKKLFVFCLGFLFVAYTQDVFAQQNARPTLTQADYEEMIDNYDGLFRNHKKTDGIKIIDAKKLADVLNTYEGRQVALVYARYLKTYPAVEGKKKRITLLLKIKKIARGAGSANYQDEYEYRDLGLEFAMCPLPPDCSVDN
jgi:hypothetical protein